MSQLTKPEDVTPSVAQTAHDADTFAGLQPAFQNVRTGESHLAQCEPGIPASQYGFAGLPDEWVVERDADGFPTALHPDVVPGYWRDARFIELSQLASLPHDA